MFLFQKYLILIKYFCFIFIFSSIFQTDCNGIEKQYEDMKAQHSLFAWQLNNCPKKQVLKSQAAVDQHDNTCPSCSKNKADLHAVREKLITFEKKHNCSYGKIPKN